MNATCPCGLKKDYLQCCGLFIETDEIPQTPEALMRSRYTAYSQANIAYIEKTMRGKAAENYNPKEAYQWAKQATWLGLSVINSEMDANNPERSFVEFIANYQINNERHVIHERSEFHRNEGRWFYVAGQSKQTSSPSVNKIGRNDPCPCGSGKKYKKCCGK